ncbi:hypothetical protein BCR36DRAFT_284556, partial [Piromyces finnis]
KEILNDNNYIDPIFTLPQKKNNYKESDKVNITNKKKSKFSFLRINRKNSNKSECNNNDNDYIINIDNDIVNYSVNTTHHHHDNKARNNDELILYDIEDDNNNNSINNYYNKRGKEKENNNVYYSNQINQTNLKKLNYPLNYNYNVAYNSNNNSHSHDKCDKYNQYKNNLNTNKPINTYANNNKNQVHKSNIIMENEKINNLYNIEMTRKRVPVSNINKYPREPSQSLEDSVIIFNSYNTNNKFHNHTRFYYNNNTNISKNINHPYNSNIKENISYNYENKINSHFYNNNERNYAVNYHQRVPVDTAQFLNNNDNEIDTKTKNMNMNPLLLKNENLNYYNQNNINNYDYEDEILQFDTNENGDIVNSNSNYNKNIVEKNENKSNQSYESNVNENINKSANKSDVKKKESQSIQNQENNVEGEKTLKQILASIPPVSPYFINGKKSIRILSFNIFLRPPGIKNNDSDHKAMRLAYFCERVIHSFDIICLQEFFAYGSSRQSKFLAYAKNAGFEYSLTLSSKNLLNTSIDSGLVIISRYPIIKSERLTFKRGIKTDRFYSKGALYARILCSPNKEINLFNTHLQSGISNTNNTEGVNLSDALVVTRCKQLMALKSFIDSCTENSNGPILLAGDMNVNSRRSFKNGNDSEEYILMKKILAGEWVAVINHHDTTTVSTASKSQNGGMNTVSKVIGGNKKFTDTVPRYKVTDLVYESYGKHPITKGDVESFETMKPTETILTSTSSLWTCLSVDYLFLMEHKDNTNPNNNYSSNSQYNNEKEKESKIDITVNTERTQVNKFLTSSREYTQLSDHYGISSVLNVN